MVAEVTLSMEVELGWGINPGSTIISEERIKETKNLERILDICSEYGIEFSFDIVGHLFHRSCDGEHNSPHIDGYFENDPGTDFGTNPLYYAPDLIESIRSSQPSHDIISHTYSHPRLDKISEEAIRWEFDQMCAIFEEAGLSEPTSLVPPKHFSPSECRIPVIHALMILDDCIRYTGIYLEGIPSVDWSLKMT